jgi:hypothetical protein
VGDWQNAPDSPGTKNQLVRLSTPLSFQIIQAHRRIIINSPISGKISIVNVQGRVMHSMCTGKSGPIIWDAKEAAKGLYFVRLRNETQTFLGKVFVQ